MSTPTECETCQQRAAYAEAFDPLAWPPCECVERRESTPTIMSGPMDPERLADTRAALDGPSPYMLRRRAAELLADRDHWQAEAERLRGERDALLATARAVHCEVLDAATGADNALRQLEKALYPEGCDDAQASLDAAAHAQLEGQYAAAGGAPPAIVAAVDRGEGL